MRSLTESLRYIDLSNGSSADFNKLIRSISSDIVTVFNMANQSEEAAKKNLSIITQENLFLQRRIKELEEKLTSIKRQYQQEPITEKDTVLFARHSTLRTTSSIYQIIYTMTQHME